MTPTDPWTVVAGCAGKIAFDSAVVAHQVAKRRGFRGRSPRIGRRPGEVYRCPHCGRWHIGRRFDKDRMT